MCGWICSSARHRLVLPPFLLRFEKLQAPLDTKGTPDLEGPVPNAPISRSPIILRHSPMAANQNGCLGSTTLKVSKGTPDFRIRQPKANLYRFPLSSVSVVKLRNSFPSSSLRSRGRQGACSPWEHRHERASDLVLSWHTIQHLSLPGLPVPSGPSRLLLHGFLLPGFVFTSLRVLCFRLFLTHSEWRRCASD